MPPLKDNGVTCPNNIAEPSSPANNSNQAAIPNGYAWARAEFARRGLPFSEAELERMVAVEEGLPLESFIAELERLAQGI